MTDIRAITDPLGIQWHPFDKKGHDFGFTTEYTGFLWDIANKRVALPEKKRLKYLAKVSAFLHARDRLVREDETVSLHGTLQHVCFVYRRGGVLMPALSRFAAGFPNRFAKHHIPDPVLRDLKEWSRLLQDPSYSRSLLPRTLIDLDVWVDASDWGIGLVVGSAWAAWRLCDAWRVEGRDIGWAEMVAVELAVLWLSHVHAPNDVDFVLRGDNTGVIDAIRKGRSRNIPRNDSLRRMLDIIIPHNILVSPSYVPSSENRADPISRGKFDSAGPRLPILFHLPEELVPYLHLCTA